MEANQQKDSREQRIQDCIMSLVHACHCRQADCQHQHCHKMKRVVTHAKICTRKRTGSCPICKQLIVLCCYHARSCQKMNCTVPFCNSIRQKLEQRRVQDALNLAAGAA